MSAFKLDVGCGGRGSIFDGFIGIDIHDPPKEPRNPNAGYLQLDFVYERPLPWADNSIDEIIAFHIIEHLSYEEGQIFLRKAYNLLKLGSKMYVSCPDLALFSTMYLDAIAGNKQAQKFWQRKYERTGKEMWPGDTFADRFNYSFHQASHVYQYDQESLINAAKKAGCECVEPLPKDHYWSRRPDHEVGIIVTK